LFYLKLYIAMCLCIYKEFDVHQAFPCQGMGEAHICAVDE